MALIAHQKSEKKALGTMIHDRHASAHENGVSTLVAQVRDIPGFFYWRTVRISDAMPGVGWELAAFGRRRRSSMAPSVG